MSDNPLRQPQQENERLLPDCPNCILVKVPGGDTKSFLQAADQSLSDGAGGENPLNVSGTKMCPPEIRYVGMKQRGLDGEYTVFYGLRDSKIPMYVFHGLQPVKAIKEMAESHGLKAVKAKEEMADFIIVTDKLVVALEVKAFSIGSEEVFSKILCKSFDQLERLRENVKMFLEAHDCKVSNDDELPLATFSLFPLAKRDHYSLYIEEKDKDRVLFGDEYIEKLKDIRKLDIVDKRKLRILLAWFYGIYSYENLSVRQIIDGPTGKKNKEKFGGVFLNNDQLEIRNCRQNYLGIIGFPGTGKTYCLVAKLVQDITGKLKEKQNQKRNGKIEDGNRRRDEKILVIHRLESTVEYIETLFWRALEQKFSKKDLHEVKGIVEFLTIIDLQVECEFLKKSDYRLKVFFDDYPNEIVSARLLNSLAKNMDFLWYTSYSIIPFFSISPLFFRRWKVDGDYIFDIDKYAFLDKAVRFTAHIFSLAETICKRMPEYHHADLRLYGLYYGPSKTSYHRYICGTRVPGDKVKFVRVPLPDEAKEKQKSDEELLDETVLDELRKQLEKFEPKSILVIPGLFPETEDERMMSFRKLLESRHDERFEDVTVTDYQSVRGQEKECVIVVCDNIKFPFKETDSDLQMILDASTRAISMLVLVFPGNLPLNLERNLIRDSTEQRTPTVYSKEGKSQESVLKEVEPLSITQLLEGDFVVFRKFSVNLHKMQPCVESEEQQSGLAAYCNLSCTDRLLNSIPIVNDPSKSFLRLKKACYFMLLIEEIKWCKTVSPEKLHERRNYLLGVLLKWMKNIKKERDWFIETGVRSFSFNLLPPSTLIQYRQIVRACRKDLEDIEAYKVWGTRYMKPDKTQETRKLSLEIQRLCSLYEQDDDFKRIWLRQLRETINDKRK